MQKSFKKLQCQILMKTNGTLIAEEWIKFFKEDISVGVLLDDYPELHNKNRLTKNNEPTAEKILQNLKLMRSSGLNTETFLGIAEIHECSYCHEETHTRQVYFRSVKNILQEICLYL